MSCCIRPEDDDQDRPSTFIIAEWRPLDALAQTFGELGAEATSALAFQAVSAAFAALALEASAHRHYTLAYHGLWGHVPSTILQGLERALSDLQEALKQWGTVAIWFEKLSEQEPGQREALHLRFDPLIGEQQHLWMLHTRLRHEHEQMCSRLPVLPSPLHAQQESQP